MGKCREVCWRILDVTWVLDEKSAEIHGGGIGEVPVAASVARLQVYVRLGEHRHPTQNVPLVPG